MTAIKLGNQQILQVRNTKFLGIYIDDGLEWGGHINHITKKIASRADVLQAVKLYLSLDNMKSLYHSLVHSHLTYGTILWGSAFKYRLHKVEILQKKAIRNNCNTIYNAPTAPLFKQLDITKLIDVYNIQLCKLMYSYISGTLLTPLKTIFTSNSAVHAYETRHASDPHVAVRKTSIAARTFIHQCPRAWLALPGRFEKNLRSQNHLTNKLNYIT